MTISQVGSTVSNDGQNVLTVSITISNVGDLVVLCFGARAATAASSGVAGGNVTTWHQATGYLDTGDDALQEIWWGVTTGTGTATITVTNSTASSGSFNALRAAEYSASPSGTWSVVVASPSTPGSGANTQSGTTITYPTLTGTGLYVGTAIFVFQGSNAGSTSGFTYEEYSATHIQVVQGLNVTNGAPTATASASDFFSPVAALFTATPSGGTSGTRQPRATVPVPRRVPARGQSRGQRGAAYVAVAAPPQEYRTLPRRVPARGVSHGASGQAYVAVPAPHQAPYLPPRRKLARAVIGFTPVTTTNAVPAVSGPPLQARPVPRRAPARGQSRGQGGQAYVAVPAPAQPPPGPRRPGPRRAISRGQGGQAFVAVPAPRQAPYLPPRRRPARAWVQFTPVTTTNTPVAFVAVPAPRQMATWPRRRPARAVIGFTPVTTTNGPPHHRPPGGTPSSDDARQFKRWLLWGA